MLKVKSFHLHFFEHKSSNTKEKKFLVNFGVEQKIRTCIEEFLPPSSQVEHDAMSKHVVCLCIGVSFALCEVHASLLLLTSNRARCWRKFMRSTETNLKKIVLLQRYNRMFH